MHVKILDNVSGAQNGASIDLNSPLAQVRAVKRVEVAMSGTITSITPALQISFDGTNFVEAAIGSAADTYLAIETSAPFCRVVTTGTGGPYDADMYIGRVAGA